MVGTVERWYGRRARRSAPHRPLFTMTAAAAAHRYSGAHKHAAVRASMRARYKYAPPFSPRLAPATLTYYPLNAVYFRASSSPLPQRTRLCSNALALSLPKAVPMQESQLSTLSGYLKASALGDKCKRSADVAEANPQIPPACAV
ncbi:hypothetical protein O3G_MSEX011507 [Manduca sexta]|uniref:Uncharacterized protein n=1 Tax=Manduca sexta TaxID=7130 RepID=A0A921ZMM1_MANSE|nr:hypothetical protein O3G_MSEX011507 [Manduca sexta]